jgi:hypothetical protein
MVLSTIYNHKHSQMALPHSGKHMLRESDVCLLDAVCVEQVGEMNEIPQSLHWHDP